jgi:hypothetical protein
MVGALNEAYNFFYNWLFSGAPVTAFSEFAVPITMFVSLFFVCAMAYFAFKLVTGLVRLIYYMFER